MSIETEILRIKGARDTLRTKAVELKISAGTEKLDELADDYNGIVNQGSVSARVKVGETYTIPKGYHDGTGTVSGVSGGGSYNLQSKQATPTKKPQQITPDSGYYGLSDVTVAAIPDAYQDVTSVTATEPDVLSTKVFVDSKGSVKTGTMPNNGSVQKTLDGSNASYAIPKGYHDGTGAVSIAPETKSATPSKELQTVQPTPGKVLTSVSVNPIPAEYITTTDANAIADDLLLGKTAYVGGEKVTGTMPNNESVSKKLDASTTSFAISKGYHDGNGSVSISVETKTATPSEESQVVSPTVGSVLSKVTVDAIPTKYKDTTPVTATSDHVLEGDVFVDLTGKQTGTMPNNVGSDHKLDADTTEYTIPVGYHDGTGTVSVSVEEKSATPTKFQQEITPTSGKLLSKVTVKAIPAQYIETTDATAIAGDILASKTAYVNGEKITGSMANNGDVTGTFDGLSTTSYEVPAGYTTGGTVSLTGEIETELAAI